MRETLTLLLYCAFVEVLSYTLVVLPAYSFQIGSSGTGYVRIASQAATAAMLSAQRSATLAAVAPLISSTSAGSVAVRMVAGSVGWPALGIVAGMTLAMLYYNSTQTAALKAAAGTPGPWTIPGVTATIQAVVTDANYNWAVYGDGRINNGCPASAYNQLVAAGFTIFQTISLTLVNGNVQAGPYCAMGKLKTAAGAQPSQGAASPATPAQIQTYISGLPASDPLSVESSTVPVGSQSTPTPADATASNPVPASALPTSVVPASTVAPTDLVIDANAPVPGGTQTTQTTPQQTTSGTSTTTTTTTTNPNGSTTTT